VTEREHDEAQRRPRRDERVPHDAEQFAHWMMLAAFEDAKRRTR
jgi:hypothetical protein